MMENVDLWGNKTNELLTYLSRSIGKQTMLCIPILFLLWLLLYKSRETLLKKHKLAIILYLNSKLGH